MDNKIPLIVIAGATSSGKSALGIRLAQKWNGEIVSADSRQVYKYLDLGTGKVTKAEQRVVSHHLIDVMEPGKRMDIARYKRLADKAISDIWKRGKIPFLVGGSALYLRAVVHNYSIPHVGLTKKRKELETKSRTYLLRLLKQKDLRTYEQIDRYNKRRILRALEVYFATGVPFSQHQKKEESMYYALFLALDVPREELYARIDDRVDARIKKGMLKEVEQLLKQKVSKRWLKNLGLEYRYITEYLQSAKKLQTTNYKLSSKIEMIQKLKYAIHDFARRQLVWFRKEKSLQWIQDEKQAHKLIKEFLKK